MPYVLSVCKAGRTKEISKYHTKRYRPEHEKRNKKENPTSEKQQEVNDRMTERKLTWILNENFDSECHYWTFTSRERMEIEDFKKARDKLMRDLRRLFKKHSQILKYVETMECGKRGMQHIHIVMDDRAVERTEIEKLWKGYGRPHSVPLDESGQYRKLAGYFLKYNQKTRNTDEQLQKKAYNCSRNLIRPKPKKKIMRWNTYSEEIKVPKGWYLDKETEERGITADGYKFIRYTLVQYYRRC